MNVAKFSRKWPTYVDWTRHAGGLLSHKKMSRAYFERIKRGHKKYPRRTLKELRGRRPERERYYVVDVDIRDEYET